MDPNHGAFLFAGGKDFIEFYASAAQLEKAAGIDFRFFSLDELRYDENKKSKEVKTWSGMLRTLITGSKYRDNHFFSSRLIMSFYALPAGASGALLGAGLGIVIPVIGTTFGALTGGALGAGLAAVLCKLAFANKHHGLLSVPHLLMDKWQDLKESLAALISPKPAYEAQVNARQEIAADSTKDILSIIKPAQDGIQNQTTTTPVLEEKKNLPLEATSLKDAESNSDLALEPEIHSWIRATPSLKPYSSP